MAAGRILSPDLLASLSPLLQELLRDTVARASLELNRLDNGLRNAWDVSMQAVSEGSYMDVDSGVQGQQLQSHQQLAPFGVGAHDGDGRKPPDTKTCALGIRNKKIDKKKKHRLG